jgi:hypothetical protein
MGIKNAEFDADFESVEKTGEKVTEKGYGAQNSGLRKNN